MLSEARNKLLGHLWTVGPNLLHRVWPSKAPPARLWSTSLRDPTLGSIRLSGLLREEPGSDTLLVVVHGLGGEPERAYCVKAARAASRRGISCLRLALRGADRLGEDYYHAGLTEDIAAAMRSEQAARYRRILLLGYSMGGHVCLLAAAVHVDARLAAVAAVCPPLDLAAAQRAIDEPGRWIYRRHVIGSLNEIYRAVARRRPVPTPVEVVERARTMRHRDELTICPRFGFTDADDYYTRAGIGNRLSRMGIPALVVAGDHDPMVPGSAMAGPLRHASPLVEVRHVDAGGHVFFPETDGSLEEQVIAWMQQRSR